MTHIFRTVDDCYICQCMILDHTGEHGSAKNLDEDDFKTGARSKSLSNFKHAFTITCCSPCRSVINLSQVDTPLIALKKYSSLHMLTI